MKGRSSHWYEKCEWNTSGDFSGVLDYIIITELADFWQNWGTMLEKICMSLACLLFLTMLLNVTHYDYAQVLPEGLLSWSFRIGKMLSAGWNAIRFSNETFIQFSHCSVFMTSVRYSKMQKSGKKKNYSVCFVHRYYRHCGAVGCSSCGLCRCEYWLSKGFRFSSF